LDTRLFTSELWKPALDKYAEATGLSVDLFDAEQHVVFSALHPTPLVALFKEYGFEPALFCDCARRCLDQTIDRPALVVTERHGLTVVGTSLVLEGEIVGAAVAGYALTQFSQVVRVQHWAQSAGVPFGRLWDIVQRQPPVPERRLVLHGELLQVLGDALLRENHRTRQLEDVAGRLRAADAAKDEFLAMLGHELRNPLSTVRNAVVAARLDPAGRDRALGVAQRGVAHLARLIDDVLDVARITQRKITLHTQKLRVASLVQRTVETTRQFVEDRAQTLTVSLGDEDAQVDGDPERLEQVLVNLITNAAKYTAPGGHIDVATRRADESVTLRVRDNGIGIAPEVLPRVFDLFVQGDRSLDRAQGGLGIGLTLVKRLVELHGGHVAARSEGVGKGAEFEVKLPVVLPLAEETAAPPAPDRRAITGKASVLVVEDNPDTAESLMMLLELLGHRVRVAPDGIAALELARANAPDVMLVDIGLPGIDGYEVARRVRRDPALKDIVLVALTGYGRDEDKQTAARAGFDHHLVKPVDPEALHGLVAQLGKEPGEATIH
jgi:signal transduction histidine kinase/ActR/RegA family two-component response regulator